MGGPNVEAILGRALAGARPSPAEAALLVEQGDLLTLGLVARELAARLHPGGIVGFIVDQTVAYSNVCRPACPHCAGTVKPGHPRAFALSPADLAEQVGQAAAAGAGQVVLQGGHRDDLPWQYYLDLLRTARRAHPLVDFAAFSFTEVQEFANLTAKSTGAVLADLQAAGLDVLVSGGVEAMPARRPEHQALLRSPGPGWTEVAQAAASLGIPCIATFPYGLGETAAERAAYLYRVQAVQAATGRQGRPVFRALVPFPASSRDQDDLQQQGGEEDEAGPTGHEYLRMVALARILVDNVPHIQASPLTQGARVAQVALDCGATDMGGTQMQYREAELSAGRRGPMAAAEFARLIRDAGRTPVRRDARYRPREPLPG